MTTAAMMCMSMSAIRVAALAPPMVAGPANDRTANAHAMTTNAVRAFVVARPSSMSRPPAIKAGRNDVTAKLGTGMGAAGALGLGWMLNSTPSP